MRGEDKGRPRQGQGREGQVQEMQVQEAEADTQGQEVLRHKAFIR